MIPFMRGNMWVCERGQHQAPTPILSHMLDIEFEEIETENSIKLRALSSQVES